MSTHPTPDPAASGDDHHRRYEDHDRLNVAALAEYLGWRLSTVRKLVATEAWRWDERDCCTVR